MNDQHTVILHQRYPIFPEIEHIKEVFDDEQDGRQRAYMLRIHKGAEIRLDTVMSPDGQFGLQEPSVAAKGCRKDNETLLGMVNADFFNMTNGVPQGPVVMDGCVIKEDMPDNTYFFGVRVDGTPIIGDRKAFLENRQMLKMAVGGRHLLVDGDAFPEIVLEPRHDRHPRTAVCICENGDLLLVVLDGRSPGAAEGLHLERFARYLKALGAQKALNLDGGGSSVMALRMPGRKETEIVSMPSDGFERICANGIALYAQRQGDGVCHSAYIYPQQEYVAPGTRMALSAYGMDHLLGPCALPENSRFSVPADSGCTISEDGVFHAAAADCDVTVSISTGEQLLGTTLLRIRTPDALQVPKDCICTEGEVHSLDVRAMREGYPMLTNSTAYRFQTLGDIGWFDEDGFFHAKEEACEGDVLVSTQSGELSAVFHVRVGRLPQQIDIAPDHMEAVGCSMSSIQPLYYSPRCGQQVYQLECLQENIAFRFDAPVYKWPRAVGMWVHSTEGVLPDFTLTIRCGTETLPAVPFTPGEPSDSVWTYMEAPLHSRVGAVQAVSVGISAAGVKGARLAIDSFRLVYDYVNDDVQLPVIRQVTIRKYATEESVERIKITAQFGVDDLLPCYAPIAYKRLRILIDDKEYTGMAGHYGVNKGAASMMLHQFPVSRGKHRVRVCARTFGGKQTWADITFDTDQLEVID